MHKAKVWCLLINNYCVKMVFLIKLKKNSKNLRFLLKWKTLQNVMNKIALRGWNGLKTVISPKTRLWAHLTDIVQGEGTTETWGDESNMADHQQTRYGVTTIATFALLSFKPQKQRNNRVKRLCTYQLVKLINIIDPVIKYTYYIVL